MNKERSDYFYIIHFRFSLLLLCIFVVGCLPQSDIQEQTNKESTVIDTRNFPDEEDVETGTESESESESDQKDNTSAQNNPKMQLDAEAYLDNNAVFLRYPNTFETTVNGTIPEKFNLEVDITPLFTVRSQDTNEVFLYIDAVDNTAGSIDVWYEQNDAYPTTEELTENHPTITYNFTDYESQIIHNTLVGIRSIDNGTSSRKEYVFHDPHSDTVYVASIIANIDIPTFENSMSIQNRDTRTVLETMKDIILSIEVNEV